MMEERDGTGMAWRGSHAQVLSMALSKGDVEENINSRVICARILGVLAVFMVRAAAH